MDFWIIAKMLGGLGLFLFGMKLMSEGLEAITGDKLRDGLEKMTKNRFAAVGVGAGVTAVIQSSSATIVMIVGFVNAGMMTLVQAINVGMGANIGTTITAQIVAFNIMEIAPAILFAGILMILFAKKRSMRRLGEIIGGLGILFFGMNYMSEAFAPLREYPEFVNALASFENPWLGLLVGLAFTAAMQSSSATMGIAQAFAMQGVLSLDAAVYLILGFNIGACITAILASLGGTKTAKRTAVALLFFNIIGVMVFMLLLQITPLIDWVKSWSPDEPVRQLANFHTVFNLVTTGIFLCFPHILAKMATAVIPGEDEKTEGQRLEFLASPLPDSPTVVVALAVRETTRMLKIARDNFNAAVESFTEKNEKLFEEVHGTEKTVNYLNREITNILVALPSADNISEPDMRTITGLLHALMNIERISDIAVNIADLTMHSIDNKIKLGKKGTEEIEILRKQTDESMKYAASALSDHNLEAASRALEIEEEIDNLEIKIKKNHVKRLKKGDCTPIASTVFTDIITMMERVADHSANIASVMLKGDL